MTYKIFNITGLFETYHGDQDYVTLSYQRGHLRSTNDDWHLCWNPNADGECPRIHHYGRGSGN